MDWPFARALVYLRRIALALERAYPPVPRVRRRAVFSVASTEDFERGYERQRGIELEEDPLPPAADASEGWCLK